MGIVWQLAQWPSVLLWVSMFAGMTNTVNDGCAAGKNEAPLSRALIMQRDTNTSA
ncbi:Uncharacterised protein [Serratia quinivorans]|nr:Uncharacterised protein [Serratia quinivorans]CAI2049868.1 Uncharacterised protein [Serratia quinivorans]